MKNPFLRRSLRGLALAALAGAPLLVVSLPGCSGGGSFQSSPATTAIPSSMLLLGQGQVATFALTRGSNNVVTGTVTIANTGVVPIAAIKEAQSKKTAPKKAQAKRVQDDSVPDETDPSTGAPDDPTPVPNLPDGTDPDETTPDEATPSPDLPGGSVPGGSVPGGSVPGGSAPGEGLPVETTANGAQPLTVQIPLDSYNLSGTFGQNRKFRLVGAFAAPLGNFSFSGIYPTQKLTGSFILTLGSEVVSGTMPKITVVTTDLVGVGQ